MSPQAKFGDYLPVSLGVYEHYKSTLEAPKLYLVIGTATHSETRESLVLYVPLYTTDEFAPCARPASMWREMVDLNGVVFIDSETARANDVRLRFTFVRKATPDDLVLAETILVAQGEYTRSWTVGR